MMTVDMDRLLNAPDRGAADAGAPQRAGRAGATHPPFSAPAGRASHRSPARGRSGARSEPATPSGAPYPVPAQRSAAGAAPEPAAGSWAGADQLRPVRRVVVGVLVGALTMLGVATLDAFGGATVPVLGSFAALPAPADEPQVVEVPAPPSAPGTCLNWTRVDAADTAVVDCAEPHLFEQAGSVALVDQTALPDDRQWRQLVGERCTPVVTGYLNGKFDPDGRFRVGALKPSAAKWAEGDRELRCGVQSASRSGALYPLVGRAAEADQSAVHPPGTCLAIDGRTIGDPVDCAGPHAVETVGIVDLSEKFPEGFPAVGDQDAFLQPECGRIAAEYAGGAEVITDKKLTVYWDNLSEESWAAGSRKVNCNLAALLPDRSGFAPVTGPVKGEVVVGDSAAPPAADTPKPGAPAPSTTAPADPSDPPASDAPPAGEDQPPPGSPEAPPAVQPAPLPGDGQLLPLPDGQR